MDAFGCVRTNTQINAHAFVEVISIILFLIYDDEKIIEKNRRRR